MTTQNQNKYAFKILLFCNQYIQLDHEQKQDFICSQNSVCLQVQQRRQLLKTNPDWMTLRNKIISDVSIMPPCYKVSSLTICFSQSRQVNSIVFRQTPHFKQLETTKFHFIIKLCIRKEFIFVLIFGCQRHSLLGDHPPWITCFCMSSEEELTTFTLYSIFKDIWIVNSFVTERMSSF